MVVEAVGQSEERSSVLAERGIDLQKSAQELLPPAVAAHANAAQTLQPISAMQGSTAQTLPPAAAAAHAQQAASAGVAGLSVKGGSSSGSSSRASSAKQSTRNEGRSVASNMLTAPAPLPRIPGFSPSHTPDSVASARTPIPHNPTPPARRRAASFSFDPSDLDVPLADTLLVERSKALMSKMDDMLHDDKLPPGQVKLVSQMLEVLQNGTQAGKPVAVSGARLAINAPPISAPPRRIELGGTSFDQLNWNQLIVGLERFDPKKKLAALSSSSPSVSANFIGSRAAPTQARAQDQLVNRIMQGRDSRIRAVYSN